MWSCANGAGRTCRRARQPPPTRCPTPRRPWRCGWRSRPRLAISTRLNGRIWLPPAAVVCGTAPPRLTGINAGCQKPRLVGQVLAVGCDHCECVAMTEVAPLAGVTVADLSSGIARRLCVEDARRSWHDGDTARAEQRRGFAALVRRWRVRRRLARTGCCSGSCRPVRRAARLTVRTTSRAAPLPPRLHPWTSSCGRAVRRSPTTRCFIRRPSGSKPHKRLSWLSHRSGCSCHGPIDQRLSSRFKALRVAFAHRGPPGRATSRHRRSARRMGCRHVRGRRGPHCVAAPRRIRRR